MSHFSKRKYTGHIHPLYRVKLIDLHLDEVKKYVKPGNDPFWHKSNPHQEVIAILCDNSLEWKQYRLWCKVKEVTSYKPKI